MSQHKRFQLQEMEAHVQTSSKIALFLEAMGGLNCSIIWLFLHLARLVSTSKGLDSGGLAKRQVRSEVALPRHAPCTKMEAPPPETSCSMHIKCKTNSELDSLQIPLRLEEERKAAQPSHASRLHEVIKIFPCLPGHNQGSRPWLAQKAWEFCTNLLHNTFSKLLRGWLLNLGMMEIRCPNPFSWWSQSLSSVIVAAKHGPVYITTIRSHMTRSGWEK